MNHPVSPEFLNDRLAGVLFGTAVGDALGLPAEGLSPTTIERRWGTDWRYRLLPGRGMVSDDTEHTFFVGQALLARSDDPAGFQRALAWKLRLWLLGLPAGVGFATLRAILKLWIGFPPHRSGVCSAGNGPAMRSALIGAFFAGDMDTLTRFVNASTTLTHTDPRARVGALAIAHLAAWAIQQPEARSLELEPLCNLLEQLGPDPEWQGLVMKMRDAGVRGDSVEAFARSLGLEKGVTGYIYHTVPVAIYAWHRHAGDFEAGLTAALRCGGDTDTVGAITGALLGAGLGRKGIPKGWVEGILEWPRSRKVLETLAGRLAALAGAGIACRPVRYFWPGLIPRNLFFLTVVLMHGFRRLIPR